MSRQYICIKWMSLSNSILVAQQLLTLRNGLMPNQHTASVHPIAQAVPVQQSIVTPGLNQGRHVLFMFLGQQVGLQPLHNLDILGEVQFSR